MPQTLTVRGGTHYYDSKIRQWPDTVIAILEYQTAQGVVTALYQAITTNGYGGHFEVFMGDEGTLEISESPARGSVYRNPEAPDWDKWVRLKFLDRLDTEEPAAQAADAVIQVEETRKPLEYAIPVELKNPYSHEHLENFFSAIRGQGRLACPAETAYPATVAALAINDAVEKGRTQTFTPEDFTV